MQTVLSYQLLAGYMEIGDIVITESNKHLVKRYYEKVVSTGNIEEVESYISPEYTGVMDGKRYEIGITGAKDHIVGVRKTYPDLNITIDRQIAEGEWVATCITAKGTHEGEWLGIVPTGKKLTFTGVNVDRVVDNKTVEHGGAANMFGPLIEAGAIKVVGKEE